jgi:hypothetical protein
VLRLVGQRLLRLAQQVCGCSGVGGGHHPIVAQGSRPGVPGALRPSRAPAGATPAAPSRRCARPPRR